MSDSEMKRYEVDISTSSPEIIAIFEEMVKNNKKKIVDGKHRFVMKVTELNNNGVGRADTSHTLSHGNSMGLYGEAI